MNKYHSKLKYPKESKPFTTFIDNLNSLFDIALCKCVQTKCKCDDQHKIPANCTEFIHDQRTSRLLIIEDLIIATEESSESDNEMIIEDADYNTDDEYFSSQSQSESTLAANSYLRQNCREFIANQRGQQIPKDSQNQLLRDDVSTGEEKYVPYFDVSNGVQDFNYISSEEEEECVPCFDDPSVVQEFNDVDTSEENMKRSYQNLKPLTLFVTECDRYSISDRAAAALATSLLQDFDVRNKYGDAIIIDKNFIRRQRKKNRDQILNVSTSNQILKTFSFDGKKNRVLINKKFDDNISHPRQVFETNIVVLKEPESLYLGYVVVESEKSPEISKTLLHFFEDKHFDISNLYGVLCDGEPKNTGKNNGVIRNLENNLQHPLHWFVCLLHFNELPFRHVFDKIDASFTTGPKSSTGKLAKALEDVVKPVSLTVILP